MKHTWFKCQCGRMSCPYCGGDLASCTVCGGDEGTLPTDCPGKRLQEATLNAIWKGYINFKDGRWVLGRLYERRFILKSGAGVFIQFIKCLGNILPLMSKGGRGIQITRSNEGGGGRENFDEL